MPKYPPVSYVDYLKINELLSLQNRRSAEFGASAHDEMLFIITHQTYELWFKQILVEIESVLEIFAHKLIDETDMSHVVSRLQRVVEIQKLLVSQVSVLETMTPLDFLDFRQYLYPASGFQSVQFRLLENKLGLRPASRLTYNALPYHATASQSDRKTMLVSESEPTLFCLVDNWLARTPFLQIDNFHFWKAYQGAVETIFEEDRATVEGNLLLKGEEKERNLKEIAANQATFEALFDAKKYAELQQSGAYRLSFRALHATLLIHLYRDQPVLNLPFQILTALQDMDELMTTWRYRHSLMAHRMLGRKVGTGGSSGAQYLKDATDKHRVFTDFFNLATFLIPRSRRPELPKDVRQKLGFHYSVGAVRSE